MHNYKTYLKLKWLYFLSYFHNIRIFRHYSYFCKYQTQSIHFLSLFLLVSYLYEPLNKISCLKEGCVEVLKKIYMNRFYNIFGFIWQFKAFITILFIFISKIHLASSMQWLCNAKISMALEVFFYFAEHFRFWKLRNATSLDVFSFIIITIKYINHFSATFQKP